MDVRFGFKGAQAIGNTSEIINMRTAPSRAPFFLAILVYFLGPPPPHRIIVIIDNDNRNAIILIDNSVSIIAIIDNGENKKR